MTLQNLNSKVRKSGGSRGWVECHKLTPKRLEFEKQENKRTRKQKQKNKTLRAKIKCQGQKSIHQTKTAYEKTMWQVDMWWATKQVVLYFIVLLHGKPWSSTHLSRD